MSDVGSSTDAVMQRSHSTLAQHGATVMPGTLADNIGTGDSQPGRPYGSLLSAFNGISPNGTVSTWLTTRATRLNL